MKPDQEVDRILKDARGGRPITKSEATLLLGLPENSLESSLLRSTATIVNRERFANSGLLLGQIGVDMAPCDGDCAFCFFARSHTAIEAALLSTDEIVSRCNRIAVQEIR
jgi:biotin synthase